MTTVRLRLCQEAEQLAACRIEGALLGFGLVVGEQRAAILANEVENDLFDRHSPQAAVLLQSADHLAAKNPDVVAVPPQGRARQLQRQQSAQEGLEVLHQPRAGRNVTRFIRPTPWPLIEVRTVGPQGVWGGLSFR